MENNKIYSYDKDSRNIMMHLLYYALILVIRPFYVSKSDNKLSIFLFVICFVVLLFTSSYNSPQILPARKAGKRLYYLRLLIKCTSYFLILNIRNTYLLTIYLVAITLCELRIRNSFMNGKERLFYSFDDADIEKKFLENRSR